MGEICHNCKSEFTFFDGEVYQCLNCTYMWIPETPPVKTLKPNNKEEIKKQLRNKISKDEKLL